MHSLFTQWHFAQWHLVAYHIGGQADGYMLYRGVAAPDAIDYGTPIGWADAGTGQAVSDEGVEWIEDTVYYVGIRAVSNAGIVETNTDQIVRVLISGGAVTGPAPNAIRAEVCLVEAVASGRVRLTVAYDGRGAAGVATAIEVARVVDRIADWANPLQTIAIAHAAMRRVVLDEVFDHGERVQLAVRGVTAEGVPGNAARLNQVTADAVGPVPVQFVTGAQA